IAIHAIDAEDADSPLFQVGAEGADHALAFHLPFVAAARREGEVGPAVIAVNRDAHVAIETVRVPTLMVTMHAVRGYRVDGRAQVPNAFFRPEEKHVVSGQNNVVPPPRRGNKAMKKPAAGRRTFQDNL